VPVKISISAQALAVIIDLLVPDLLKAKLSHRHKFRYFLVATGLSKKPVLQDQAEWMELREEVREATPCLDPFGLRVTCRIEREVLTMGHRGHRSHCRA